MTRLPLALANTIISAALEEGKNLALQPLCVAVVDAGSHLIALQRQEQASTLRPQIAHGKAAGALSLGMSSRKIGEIAVERPTFINALASLAPLAIVPSAGGVIILDTDGEIMGAVGVTGDSSDNDEICALAGIAAAGLSAQGSLP